MSQIITKSPPLPRSSMSNWRLPTELWRYIVQYAAEIPGEFDGDELPLVTRVNRLNAYIISWKAAFKNRLHLALVSRNWHSIAADFLHSSLLLLSHHHVYRFTQLVASPAIARRVKRITIATGSSWELDTSYKNALNLCNNLRVYVDTIDLSWCWPESLPKLAHLELNYITGTSDSMDSLLPVIQTLSTLPALRTLRLTKMLGGWVPASIPPPGLGNLEELVLDMDNRGARYIVPLYTKVLPGWTLPKLHALTIGEAACAAPVINRFASQLDMLGLDRRPKRSLCSCSYPIAMPQLRHFVAKHRIFHSDWRALTTVISLDQVELVDIQLGHDVDGPDVDWEVYWEKKQIGLKLGQLLAIFKSTTQTPHLNTINFDFGLSLSNIFWRYARPLLLDWLKALRISRPKVTVQSKYYDIHGRPNTIPLSYFLRIETNIESNLPKVQAEFNTSREMNQTKRCSHPSDQQSRPTTSSKSIKSKQSLIKTKPTKLALNRNPVKLPRLHIVHTKLAAGASLLHSPDTSIESVSSEDELKAGFKRRKR